MKEGRLRILGLGRLLGRGLGWLRWLGCGSRGGHLGQLATTTFGGLLAISVTPFRGPGFFLGVKVVGGPALLPTTAHLGSVRLPLLAHSRSPAFLNTLIGWPALGPSLALLSSHPRNAVRVVLQRVIRERSLFLIFELHQVLSQRLL